MQKNNFMMEGDHFWIQDPKNIKLTKNPPRTRFVFADLCHGSICWDMLSVTVRPLFAPRVCEMSAFPCMSIMWQHGKKESGRCSYARPCVDVGAGGKTSG